MKCRNNFIQAQLEGMGWLNTGKTGVYTTAAGESREYVIMTRPQGVSNKLEGRIFQVLAKAEKARKEGKDPQPFVQQAQALLS